jgi:hypothetical protein
MDFFRTTFVMLRWIKWCDGLFRYDAQGDGVCSAEHGVKAICFRGHNFYLT